MNKLKNIYICIFSVLLFTGCSITNGTPKPNLVKGKATVFLNDSLINYPKANMYFEFVDGKEISNFWSINPISKIELDEGEHKIQVSFYSDGVGGSTTIKNYFKKDKIYEIVALKKRQNILKITLEDVTNKQAIILLEKKVIGTYQP